MNDRHVGRIRDSQSLAAIAELSVFPTPADEFLIHAAEAPIGMFCKPKTATGTEIGDDLFRTQYSGKLQVYSDPDSDPDRPDG